MAVAPHREALAAAHRYSEAAGLYPIYVRGEAYLASHRGREAAAEFQRILDHRGIIASDRVGAVTQLRLSKASAVSGDAIKAKNA